MFDLVLGFSYECVLGNGRRIVLRFVGVDDQGEMILEVPVGSGRHISLSALSPCKGLNRVERPAP